MRQDAVNKVRTEIHCHECNRYIQVEFDMSQEGRHRIDCPNCGHDHYRMVVRGRVTEERWARSSRQNVWNNYYTAAASSSTTSSTGWVSTTGNYFYYYNTGSGTTTGTW